MRKKKSMAIASLVCGIIGGYISTFSIPAIVCGHIAINKNRKYPDLYGGKNLALVGLILGYLGLILGITLGILRGMVKVGLQNLN